jgi:nucleoside-diphosphate-sugar epimerase
MRVLILGGTLFIGRRIALELLARGDDGAGSAPGSHSGGGSLISVNGAGWVNLPVSALSNGSGDGSAT